MFDLVLETCQRLYTPLSAGLIFWSGVLTALAYYTIPVLIVWRGLLPALRIARQRSLTIPSGIWWLLAAVALFVLACGVGHALRSGLLVFPSHVIATLEGAAGAVTATISIISVVLVSRGCISVIALWQKYLSDLDRIEQEREVLAYRDDILTEIPIGFFIWDYRNQIEWDRASADMMQVSRKARNAAGGASVGYAYWANIVWNTEERERAARAATASPSIGSHYLDIIRYRVPSGRDDVDDDDRYILSTGRVRPAKMDDGAEVWRDGVQLSEVAGINVDVTHHVKRLFDERGGARAFELSVVREERNRLRNELAFLASFVQRVSLTASEGTRDKVNALLRQEGLQDALDEYRNIDTHGEEPEPPPLQRVTLATR